LSVKVTPEDAGGAIGAVPLTECMYKRLITYTADIPDVDEVSPTNNVHGNPVSYFPVTLVNNPDTFNCNTISPTYNTYGDNEIRCLIKEIEQKPIIHKDRDWGADKNNPNW
jgi:hypothetical protein